LTNAGGAVGLSTSSIEGLNVPPIFPRNLTARTVRGAVISVPTLSQTGLLAASLLLAGAGAVLLRRRALLPSV